MASIIRAANEPGDMFAAGCTMTTTASIIERCRALGFTAAGVVEARPAERAAAALAWLEAGRHGSMAWMARHVAVRLDPLALVPGARSIICVADRYADGRRDGAPQPLRGRIARYARGADYHVTLRARLRQLADELRAAHPGHRFRVCVDTAPILEREHAARAGLGDIGKNTLLIAPGLGSWLLLGEIVTTLALDSTVAATEHDPCGACTRCIDACPTQAITPWSVDASRCISYLTIERREPIDPSFHGAIGDWLFGCDICQEVCPHCQPTRRSKRAGAHPDYTPGRDALDVSAVLTWTDETWAHEVKGTAMERATLPMLRRNAIIVAVNTCPPDDRPALRARLRAIADEETETPMVRETARAALDRLDERDDLA